MTEEEHLKRKILLKRQFLKIVMDEIDAMEARLYEITPEETRKAFLEGLKSPQQIYNVR